RPFLLRRVRFWIRIDFFYRFCSCDSVSFGFFRGGFDSSTPDGRIGDNDYARSPGVACPLGVVGEMGMLHQHLMGPLQASFLLWAYQPNSQTKDWWPDCSIVGHPSGATSNEVNP